MFCFLYYETFILDEVCKLWSDFSRVSPKSKDDLLTPVCSACPCVT